MGASEKQLSLSSAHVYQKCSSYLATNQKTMLESQTPEYNTVPICIYMPEEICVVILVLKNKDLGNFSK